MSGFLTVEEASEKTGYSKGHLRRLIRSGEVKAERAGQRVYLVDAESLAAYAERMRVLGPEKFAPSR